MRLERFGDYIFDTPSAEDQLGEAIAPSDFLQTAAGAYDTRVLFESQDDPYIVTRRHEIFGTSPADLQTKLDAARGLRGKRAKLYARTYNDEVRWAWARCIRTPYTRNRRNYYYQEMEFHFQLEGKPWNGHRREPWTLDDDELLDEALYLDESVPVLVLEDASWGIYYAENEGNARVKTPIITFGAGTEDITYARVLKNHDADGVIYDFEFIGTVAANNDLVIDVGAASVLNDGVDAYNNFFLITDQEDTVNHNADEWLEIREESTNRFEVYIDGGGIGAIFKIEYADGWK